MKKIIYCALAALFCVACSKPYSVTVNVGNEKYSGMAYLSEYFTGESIDSVAVVDGTVVFNGKVGKPEAVRFVSGDFDAKFILEPGDIKVDFSPALSMFYNTSGTMLNDSLNTINNKDMALQLESMFGILSLINDAELPRKRDSIRAATDNALLELYKAATLEYKGTPISEIGAMEWLQLCIGGEGFDEALANVPRSIKSSDYIQKSIETDKGIRANQPGAKFIDFTIETGNLDGTSVSFSDYIGKGKYILVDFWASWCAPCRAGIPAIKELYNEYAGDNFDVVSIAVRDEREATLKALEKEQMPWHQIIEAQDIPMRLYGFTAIPQVMLFSPDGTLIARDLFDEAVREAVEKALGK